MEIIIGALYMLGMTVITATAIYFIIKDMNSDYSDELIQQEQLDRIEKSVEDIQRKMYKNETGHKNNISLDKMKRIKEGKPLDPTKWLKRTNRFNNQFIIQRVNGNEQMQCVTCGSIKVSARLSYSSENRSSERIYTCDKCGNKYTVKKVSQ